jgi:hypothetical protein
MLNEACSVPLVAVTTRGNEVVLTCVVPVHPPSAATAPITSVTCRDCWEALCIRRGRRMVAAPALFHSVL